MRLLHWLSKIRFPYQPLITLRISRSRLLHNLEEFRRLAPGVMVAPVLKSNAYGHGLFEAAEILHESAGRSIPFTVVDSYFEAVALRSRGCRHPLLVIGYTRPETIDCSRLRHTAFTITSIETLRALRADRRPVAIHIKLDTGMRRQGLLPAEIGEAITILQANQSLHLEGLCTHLSDADSSDESFTDGQINLWNKLAREFKTAFPDLKYLHAANTDGSRYSRDIEGNVMRLGIGLYGLSENQSLTSAMDLRPVMEMHTIISGVKALVSGETVGYGNTFRATRDMKMATIPVGYYEGLDRRLSNKGVVLVGPSRIACPIIGRVSMNITTVDVSAVPEVAAGMAAVVISGETKDPNSLHSIAMAIGTISYEPAVKIPGQIKRVIVD